MRRSALLAAAGAMALPAAAAAHVDVLPAEAVVGRAVEFTVRVPTERPLDTVAVRVLFPPEVSVFSFAEPPGWTMRTLTAPDGRFRGVEYRDGRIGIDRYQDFTFLGTPFSEGTSVWRAFQTYADGKVKPWTGTPEAPGATSPETGPTEPGPAAAVRLLPEGAPASAAAATIGSGDDDSGAAIWLGVIAIAVAGLAAVGTGLLWASRPARLPADGPEDREEGSR